jgi:fumarate reductase subunit C
MMWLLYIFLLIAVELHGTIGLYRLSVKWISFKNRNVRSRIKFLFITLFTYFIIHGSMTLWAYAEIGLRNIENGTVGEKYLK